MSHLNLHYYFQQDLAQTLGIKLVLQKKKNDNYTKKILVVHFNFFKTKLEFLSNLVKSFLILKKKKKIDKFSKNLSN